MAFQPSQPEPTPQSIHMIDNLLQMLDDESPQNRKSVKVAIIGGSLSGLLTAVALQSIGMDVHVFETTVHPRNGAGIVITPPLMDYLRQYDLVPPVMSSTQTCVIMEDDSIHSDTHTDRPRLHTSWDRLFHLLYCKFTQLSGENNYHPSKTFRNMHFNHDQGKLEIIFEEHDRFEADLVVGADGIASMMRYFVDINDSNAPTYADYVVIRGTIAEDTINETDNLNENIHTIGDRNGMSLFFGENTHFNCFIMPHNSGNESRVYNWEWYLPFPVSSVHTRLMVDNKGENHEFFIPFGSMSKDALASVMDEADALLPATFRQLYDITSSIACQTICEYECTSMIQHFHNNHRSKECEAALVLVGDSGFVLRPHTNAATAKGASDAMALAFFMKRYIDDRNFTLKDALSAYDYERCRAGQLLTKESVAFGDRVVLDTRERSNLAPLFIPTTK